MTKQAMHKTDFSKLDVTGLQTPCYVVDRVAVENNLKVLHEVQEASGAKILHALKAFSMHALADLTVKYLSGTCSSGLQEALLAQEFYGGENHVFSPAYSHKDLEQILAFADHVIFNSCSQLLLHEKACREALAKRPGIVFGLRVNPLHSEGEVPLYDPCSPGSRLGTTLYELEKYLEQEDFQQAFELISGFHFHTLCEQNFAPLQRTLVAIEEQFSTFFKNHTWINMGGGHHITKPDYDREGLINCIQDFKARNQLEVYLEPGEAVAIHSGVLVAQVMDIHFNQLPQVILDTSATCHMPDTLEMPYRPDILGAGEADQKPYTYRLGGMTCLAGDVIGDYSFDKVLVVGDKLVFDDMAHYTMVKTTTFNGTQLPSIVVWDSVTNEIKTIKAFGYQDFKERLS